MEADKMKFIDFVKPSLASGKHRINITQKVTVAENTGAPKTDIFTAEEEFYVCGNAYNLDLNDVFSIAPTENESGDFSKMLPFIVIENETFPWERSIASDIAKTPVPWVALIVLSSKENAVEAELTVSQLIDSAVPSNVYFPKEALPKVVKEKDSDICHIVEIPRGLYDSIMPEFKDLTYLTHVRRVNLADTEDEVSAKDGDFAVITANRFVPTGEGEALKSTVHLVSLLGLPERSQSIPQECTKIRLVSLFRWNVYSVCDSSKAFEKLIDGLGRNTGIIGFDLENETLKNCYVPKKHITRTGETTYSLYRSPLLPYQAPVLNPSAKATADGHLIYDPQTGIMDASYAAAFQLGRIISLNSKADSKKIDAWRKNKKLKLHKELLLQNIKLPDVTKVCMKMTEESDEENAFKASNRKRKKSSIDPR